MKKNMFLLLMLCLCLLLAACKKETNAESGIKTEYLQYGDVVFFNNIVDGQTYLFEYDVPSGEVHIFCKDATCTHTADECNSKDLIGLEIYDGKVYASNIFTDELLVLEDGRFEKVMDGLGGGFFHGKGNLYVVTSDQSLLVFENGAKSSRVLVDEYPDTPVAIWGNYLYSGFTNVTRVDLLSETPQRDVILESAFSTIDGEHIYYGTWSDYYLYRCNLDGSDPVLLLDQPITPGSLCSDEEYVYFRLYTDLDRYGEDGHDVYRMDKEDPAKIERIAHLPQPLQMFYAPPGSEYIFVTPYGVVDEDAEDDAAEAQAGTAAYAVAKDGSGWHQIELPG